MTSRAFVNLDRVAEAVAEATLRPFPGDGQGWSPAGGDQPAFYSAQIAMLTSSPPGHRRHRARHRWGLATSEEASGGCSQLTDSRPDSYTRLFAVPKRRINGPTTDL